MELFFLFCIIPLLSLGIFFVPAKAKSYLSLGLLGAGIVFSTLLLINIPSLDAGFRETYSLGFFSPIFYIDRLSMLFIVILNIVSITALVYSKRYLELYETQKTPLEIALHYAAYVWLYCSMLGVIMFRDTLTFLMFWEMMTGATFILIIFEGENKKKLKTAINYLIQMHVCLFVLLIAFSIAESSSDLKGFDAIAEYFVANKNYPLFILFFIGFGIKAGFVPLHTWLPKVHPSASGNVSGFMSGAVIKLGIYGILRTVSCLQTDLLEIGIFMIIVSAITGVYGIALAAVQTDLKKLLAYSSIENMGIIGLAIGFGILGTFWNIPILSCAGYSGALLHTLNHSMFKSMLFFSAGALCKSTHTQEMNKMGGAIKKMPYTAFLFLIGSIAICALPPLNGFISEFIIYNGVFSSFAYISGEKAFILILALLSLTLMGGLSIIAFTKALGISFLGNSRCTTHAASIEDKKLLYPLILPLSVMVFIGIFPFEAIKFVSGITETLFNQSYQYTNSLKQLSWATLLFVALFVIIYLVRRKALAKQVVSKGATWGCGYTTESSKLQYTASSYSKNFEELYSKNNNVSDIKDTDLFPLSGKIEQNTGDKRSIMKVIESLGEKISKLTIFHTGKIQHYVLFALLFMVFILILSYLNII